MDNVTNQNFERSRKPKRNKRRNKRNNSSNKTANLEGKDLLPKKQKETPKSSLPPVKIKRVKEPLEKCAYCNKVIKNIASAIRGEDEYYHFDCVLEKIKKEHPLKEGQVVSYIGRGAFAIIEKDKENKINFVETIQVENPKQFESMKKYVEEVKV